MTGRRAAPEGAAAARGRASAAPAELFTEQEAARLRTSARTLLEQPTAPYAEDGPLRVIETFVAERPALAIESDRYGNRLVRYPGTGVRRSRKAPLLAFSAHLDHPGFLYEGRGRASFHGGVPARYFAGAAVRFFALADGEPTASARITSVERRGEDVRVRLGELRGRPSVGDLGMWELEPWRLRGRRLHARVCDDLLGAAAILAWLELAIARALPDPLVGIFTRAEETGFVGCQGLLRQARLGPELRVVGLECSPKRPSARVGEGPVLRVGDRASVFDPELSARLEEAARELGSRCPAFRWQRALMDGGRCESTVYNAFGVPAGGLCLALGNYHNCGASGAIAPEYVDWKDYEGLVAWMLAASAGFGRPASGRLQRALDALWRQEVGRLRESSERVRRIGKARGRGGRG